MEAYDKNALLVAGPTTGKTKLCRDMERDGVAVADTDAIVDELIPDYFRFYKDISKAGKLGKLVKSMRSILVADEILFRKPKCVLTSIWGQPFISRLFPVKVKKPGHIMVFRADALEMVRLSRQRGSAFSTALTSKWAVSAEKYGPNEFDNLVWLPNRIYLSDVVKFTPNGWALTDLGKTFNNKGREFALKYVVEEDRKGVSHA